MDLNRIRNLNDEELTNYLKLLSNRNNSNCIVCSKTGTYTVNIQNKKKAQQKKLCSLCSNCYKELLNYLKTEDILWD